MRITAVIAAILVVTCTGNVDVPPRCCFPKVWECMMATAQTGPQGSVTTSMMVMSYESSIKKFALQEVNMKFRVVGDYNKMIQYIITPDGKCTTSKLPTEMLACIPDNATFIDTVVYGGPGGMVLDKWAVKVPDPPLEAFITVTRDGCVFVSEVVTGTISGAPFFQAIEFSNITYAIKDPSVFNVPSPPCPSDQDANMVTGKTPFFMGL
ncbi:Hypp7739 [Branchiostoma lanceolatum]|uniref:Hypp7739 protein n=1 Tax=Branchiostoma lanceolatum TaxID=7740 RepID=A0A8K0EB12_BRALA|nr:Hypp7739 [Branchiostoma lanceolatum]